MISPRFCSRSWTLSLLVACAPALIAQDEATPWVNLVEQPQYLAVLVEDVEQAKEWYQRVLGVTQLDDTEAPDGVWRVVNLISDHLWVEIIRDNRASAGERVYGFYKVGFFVPDVALVAEQVEKATGERPRVLAFSKHKLNILQLKDPEGNVIQLMSRM